MGKLKIGIIGGEASLRRRTSSTIKNTAIEMEQAAVHMPNNTNNTVLLHGTKGGCDFKTGTVFQNKFGTVVDITAPKLPDPDSHQAQLEAFLDALEGKGEMLSTPRQGVIVQQILEALYRSAETGEAVNL